MFDSKSRYSDTRVKTLKITLPDARVVAYKEVRMSPPSAATLSTKEMVSLPGERLDQLSARALGDPELFWKICDANLVMDPLTLSMTRPSVFKIPSEGK
jgi:hypothetical protein